MSSVLVTKKTESELKDGNRIVQGTRTVQKDVSLSAFPGPYEYSYGNSQTQDTYSYEYEFDTCTGTDGGATRRAG